MKVLLGVILLLLVGCGASMESGQFEPAQDAGAGTVSAAAPKPTGPTMPEIQAANEEWNRRQQEIQDANETWYRQQRALTPTADLGGPTPEEIRAATEEWYRRQKEIQDATETWYRENPPGVSASTPEALSNRVQELEAQIAQLETQAPQIPTDPTLRPVCKGFKQSLQGVADWLRPSAVEALAELPQNRHLNLMDCFTLQEQLDFMERRIPARLGR